ncbi:alpha/beta hydrolase [Microbacterium sp.]|uniref:alpha/beta hydrolase n=1 Tax=Microbacterium sp. TaxID=51671 RepID=UPI002C0686BE|nr:alpha/beta hydrolase [Microbacterium sp.]HWL78499.1 alpha/beta hydrolase [Microbacterium sp.]
MAQTFRERRDALAALGPDLVPETIAGTVQVAASDIDPAIFDGVEIVDDLPYGPHERHVLDVYRSAAGEGTPRPVLMYVHGGGFVRGAKDSDTTPYFANLGSWAVQQGWVATVINYRLAPEFPYPSGAEDVADAVTWVVENIGDHGGDPSRIFLAGQSAGAMHVADYVVGHGGYGPHGRALAGAILVSCLYDVGRASHRDFHLAYWGEDTSRWSEYATLQGLIDTDLPLLLSVSEFDEPEFQEHAARLVAEWFAQRGTYPPMHFLYGQNHLTPVYGIGSPWDELGPRIAQFIEVNGAPA